MTSTLERDSTTCLECRGAKSPTAVYCGARCRQRAQRRRDKEALREEPDQDQPAFLSDELELGDADKAGVHHLNRVCEQPSMDDLLECVERQGKVDGIIESAWPLPLWQFRKVEDAWRQADVPDRPGVRRSER